MLILTRQLGYIDDALSGILIEAPDGSKIELSVTEITAERTVRVAIRVPKSYVVRRVNAHKLKEAPVERTHGTS